MTVLEAKSEEASKTGSKNAFFSTLFESEKPPLSQ